METPVKLRHLADLQLFLRTDRLLWQAVVCTFSVFYFKKNQRASIVADQIDLALSDPEIVLCDAHTLSR